MRERHDRGLVGGVELRGREAVVAEAGHRGFGALARDVGEHHPLEEVAVAGDGRDGASHAAGAYDEDAHSPPNLAEPAVLGPARELVAVRELELAQHG